MLSVVATVTAAIPICLTGCSSATAPAMRTSPLSAAEDSDLLESPESQRYEFSDWRLLPPTPTSPGDHRSSGFEMSRGDTAGAAESATPEQQSSDGQPGIGHSRASTLSATKPGADDVSALPTAGFLVLTDGVIREAELRLSFTDRTVASFVLSAPAALRRVDGADGAIYATGTLTVEGVSLAGTALRLIPLIVSDDQAEFEATITLPEQLDLDASDNASFASAGPDANDPDSDGSDSAGTGSAGIGSVDTESTGAGSVTALLTFTAAD